MADFLRTIRRVPEAIGDHCFHTPDRGRLLDHERQQGDRCGNTGFFAEDPESRASLDIQKNRGE